MSRKKVRTKNFYALRLRILTVFDTEYHYERHGGLNVMSWDILNSLSDLVLTTFSLDSEPNFPIYFRLLTVLLS